MSRTVCWLVSGMLVSSALVGCQPAEDPTAAGNLGPTAEASAATADTSAQATPQASQSWEQELHAVEMGQSESMAVADGPVTPAQLAQLEQVADKLEVLQIDAGGVTDDDMQRIGQLPQLVHLRIRQSELSDQGIEQLVAGKPPQLQIVNLPHARLTVSGIRALQQLPQLKQLRLGGPQIDDAAVVELARLPELRSLHLIGPELTDAALVALAQSPKLSSFYLDDCKLSDSAWEALFAAKPNVHVHIDQQHHDRDPQQD